MGTCTNACSTNFYKREGEVETGENVNLDQCEAIKK